LLHEDGADRRIVLGGGRRRRVLDVIADVKADRPDQHAEQEWNAPAPALQIGFA